MRGIIYKITSPSGKIYVGQTSNFKIRMYQYKKNFKTKYNSIIFNSISKYGWESHKVDILDECYENSKEELKNKLNELEIEYIKSENSFNRLNEMGMNLTLGGDGGLGRKDTEEVKIKRSSAHIGSKRTEETKKIMSDLKKGKIPKASLLPRSEKQLYQLKYGNIGRKKLEKSSKKEKDTKLQLFLNKYESILQFDKQKNIVREWKILPMYIAKELNIKYPSLLYKVLNKKYKTCNGYYWEYKKNIDTI